MPEDVTMTHGALLFLGAITVVLLNSCTARVVRSSFSFLLMVGVVISAASSAAVFVVGKLTSGGTETSWVGLTIVWLVVCLVYMLARFVVANQPHH